MRIVLSGRGRTFLVRLEDGEIDVAMQRGGLDVGDLVKVGVVVDHVCRSFALRLLAFC